MESYVALLSRALLLGDSPTTRDKFAAIAIATVFYWVAFWGLKPLLLAVVPVLSKKSRKDQLSAMVRLPSLINCVFVVPLAWYLLATDHQLASDRFFSQSRGGNVLVALAAGFFVFDLTHSVFDFQGVPFFLHAVLCSAVYCLALLLPFCQYYGCVFLLFELSTVWLNVMWYVKFVFDLSDKSLVYRICATMFAISFFAARIVYGNYNNVFFFADVWRRLDEFNVPVLALFLTANVILTLLNAYWFWRIISVIIMGKKINKEEIAGKE